MIMKGCLFLLGLIFTTSFAFAEDLTLLTNGFNFNAYPFQDISTIEKTSLNTALSNELYDISNYILATNRVWITTGNQPSTGFKVLSSLSHNQYIQ